MSVEISGSQANSWQEIDANNTATPPDGFGENQTISKIDDTFRGSMGTIIRFAHRVMPTITVGISSSSAWTYTPVNTAFPTALKTGEWYSFISPQNNTSPTTLNINNLGAQNIVTQTRNGTALLTGGEIIANLPAVTIVDKNTNLQLINPQKGKSPTRTVLTGGSGTYAPPAAAMRINVRAVGGGGGGGGSGAGEASGGNGQATTFGTISAGGGSLGAIGAPPNGGTGGTASGADIAISGADGGSAPNILSNAAGGQGGSSPFGGGGTGGQPTTGATFSGAAGATNTGGGGGGASGASGQVNAGGGGAGAYAEALITAFVAGGPAGLVLASSYAYQVGAGGTAGAGASTGGAGGSGLIIIDEFYF